MEPSSISKISDQTILETGRPARLTGSFNKEWSPYNRILQATTGITCPNLSPPWALSVTDLAYFPYASQTFLSASCDSDAVISRSTAPSLPFDLGSQPVSRRQARNHVPRPPNAFMLFRSDFLKQIPPHVERRQQNLSRIAGQCWNLLSAEEKAKWQNRAAQVLLDHQKQNPNYKFTPAPRGSRRAKNKARCSTETDANHLEERIRSIREEYTHIAGPAVMPAHRKRRPKNRVPCPLTTQNDPTQSTLYTPPYTTFSSSASRSSDEPSLPPFFPETSFPHIIAPRRPSTSLGFITTTTNTTSAPGGSSSTCPASPAAFDQSLSGSVLKLDKKHKNTSLASDGSLVPPAEYLASLYSTSHSYDPDQSCGQASALDSAPPLLPPLPSLPEFLDNLSDESFLKSLYNDDIVSLPAFLSQEDKSALFQHGSTHEPRNSALQHCHASESNPEN